MNGKAPELEKIASGLSMRVKELKDPIVEDEF